MNRREVLSTMGLSSLLLSSSVEALGNKASSSLANRTSGRPIRVALIGARQIGGKSHLPTLVGDNKCRLVAICDVDQNVLREAVGNANQLYKKRGVDQPIKATGDFRDIMSDASIDAVCIATPDHWHVPLTRAAVLAGKDAYVEKPLSFYVTEGRELVDLVEPRDAIVQVGTQHRTMDRMFLAEATVQAGVIGDVKEVDVVINTRSGSTQPFKPEPVPPELDYDMWVGPAPWCDYNSKRAHYDFRFVSEFSGGEIANWGAHFLDTAQQVMGLDQQSPVEVEGTGKRHPVGGVHNSFYDIDVTYRYANGVKMTLKSSTKDSPMGITFRGEKASLFLNRKTFKIDKPELMKHVPKEAAKELRSTSGSHMSNWLQCIRSRDKSQLHAPLDTAHRSAILCHMANIAIEVGRPLYWDDKHEVFQNDAFACSLLNRPVREKWRI